MNKLIILILVLFILFYLIKKDNNKSFMIPDLKKYKIAEKMGKWYIKEYNSTFGIVPYKTAVMFDIDDTLLYINDSTHFKNKRSKTTLIKPMKELLDYCINNDLLVIIITARDNNYKSYTIQQLNEYSINYSFLYLHEGYQGETNDDFTNFKSKIKKELYNKYKIKIIMSVGDNYIDIVGSYSGYGLKLPNKTDSNLYEVFPNSSELVKIC